MSSHIYVRMYGVYVFELCICSFWENIFSLDTGWTWGHGAAAASLLLGCWIWQMRYFLVSGVNALAFSG